MVLKRGLLAPILGKGNYSALAGFFDTALLGAAVFVMGFLVATVLATGAFLVAVLAVAAFFPAPLVVFASAGVASAPELIATA